MKTFITLTALLAVNSPLAAATVQPSLGVRTTTIIEVDGKRFKDLNRNSKLDPYEDWRMSPEERADDLIGLMTTEEKAGLMMHGSAPSFGPNANLGFGKAYDLERAGHMIRDMKVVTFITRLNDEASKLASQNNALQDVAEGGRLGIPVTISTDPRSHFQFVQGASNASVGFSQWPETLGLAAIGDPALTRSFADTARQEYRAVGIHEALSPQIDLATEPRWARSFGTFGEDAQLSKAMAEAYVAGFQDGEDGIKAGSVIAVAKHWVGYGAAKNGWDSHSAYGQHADFSGGNFDEHLIPFEGAFKAKVAGIMPTYSILDNVVIDGKPVEPVGAGFSKELLTDLLRGRYKFDGVILSDWLITNDCKDGCLEGEAPGVTPTVNDDTFGMPWGVEGLSKVDRFVKAIDAGIDQFGGVINSDLIVQAVKENKISEERLDRSAKRILVQKFQQGLFEDPYVDPDKAASIVGNRSFISQATAAQARSTVLLENHDHLLPLKDRKRIFLVNVNPDVAKARGYDVVSTPEKADVALVRMTTPFEQPHKNYFFGARQQEGDLGFRPDNSELESFEQAAKVVPTIATIYITRAAVIPELKEKASALLANFGISDEALFDVLEGKIKPEGKLPLELPSSMQAVNAQKSDVPHDTLQPLYPIHFGLNIE